MKDRLSKGVATTCGMLREECRRVFCGYRWYITIVLIAMLWYLLSLERAHDNVIVSFDNITVLSNEAKILILAGALPLATSFSDDWKNSYIRSAAVRSGEKSYINGKIIAFVIVTFITNFIGMMLYIVVKGGIDGYGYDMVYDHYLFYDVASGKIPFMYMIIRVYLFSIVTTMYAMWGYVVSALLPNKFVAVMAPLFMGIMIEEITSHGIVQIYPYRISIGSELLGYNTPLNLLLSTIIVMVYILTAAYFFKKIVGRRIRNEIV